MPAIRPIAFLAVAALASGCSGTFDNKPANPPVTQRQRDSSVAASTVIPGAKGVGGALAAQDSAARRRAVLDSIARADSR